MSSHSEQTTQPALRMPSEWEPQAAIWLSWPHNNETWPENLREAQEEFSQLVKAIARTQAVFVMAKSSTDPAVFQFADRALGGLGNVTVLDIATNDAWARDYAPTFVKNSAGRTTAIDWRYNAWGGKYPPFDDDQKACAEVARHLGIDTISLDFCFEGGAVEVNGTGVLLSTKSCALDPNRNPDTTIEAIDLLLSRHLGTSKHIWLGGGAIEGDDTDGHIDQLARFTDEKTIVYAWTDRKDDPQLDRLKQNRDEFRQQLEITGLREFRLIPLPIPARIEHCKRRIPASYCNFLITNDLVIVPQFGQPEDNQAIEILSGLFSRRQTIGLNSLNLSVGLGSFHCLSQQQPA